MNMDQEFNSREGRDASDPRKRIHELAYALADTLRESREYQNYIEARERLEEDEENASILNDLRQQQMSLHMASMLGEDVEADNTDFENNFRLITQEPMITDYLFAEGRFFRLLGEVEKVFSDMLGIWHADEEMDPSPEHDVNLN